MNQQQKKYAQSRVSAIYERRQHDLRKLHTTPAVRLTSTERATAIRAGKAKLLPEVKRISNYDDVIDVFVFDGERAEKIDNAKLEKALAELKTEFNNVMDELMLGDAEEAIKLIKAFDR